MLAQGGSSVRGGAAAGRGAHGGRGALPGAGHRAGPPPHALPPLPPRPSLAGPPHKGVAMASCWLRKHSLCSSVTTKQHFFSLNLKAVYQVLSVSTTDYSVALTRPRVKSAMPVAASGECRRTRRCGAALAAAVALRLLQPAEGNAAVLRSDLWRSLAQDTAVTRQERRLFLRETFRDVHSGSERSRRFRAHAWKCGGGMRARGGGVHVQCLC